MTIGILISYLFIYQRYKKIFTDIKRQIKGIKWSKMLNSIVLSIRREQLTFKITIIIFNTEIFGNIYTFNNI